MLLAQAFEALENVSEKEKNENFLNSIIFNE